MKKIFISYRRKSAIDIAARIADYFKSRNFDVFYDIESMKLGKFNIQIEENIKNSDFFILILSHGALDHCNNVEDWVRKEIEYAFKYKINIIPLVLPGFLYPQILPDNITEIRNYHGVEYNAVLFNLVMQHLESLLSGKANSNKNRTQNNVVIDELIDLLTNVYDITIRYRASFLEANEAEIINSTSNLIKAVRALFFFREKNEYQLYNHNDQIQKIIEYFNSYAESYNKYINSPDRISADAQELAHSSEIKFKAFVDSVLDTLNDLKNI